MLAILIVAGGCASPLRDDDFVARDGSDRRLAARPEPVGTSSTAGDVPAAPPTVDTEISEPVSDPGGAARDAPVSTSAAGPAVAGPPFETLLSIDDPRGDHGLTGPPHGDARRFRVDANDEQLRFTVVMDGSVPDRLADGEVMGIGIDLFEGAEESEYQLFADGSSEGWFAYLHTPDGLVRYPGAFRLGGSQLEFEVPWASVGGARVLDLRLFVDWSRSRIAVVASASEDHIPDRGVVALRPN